MPEPERPAADQPRIVRAGLADQVCETIQGWILDLRYRPGDRLVIDHLARELGVSATPVRDALARLAAERLVVFEPYRGFTVRPEPTRAEIEASFEARRGIEAYAARLGCDRASSEQVRELAGLAGRIAERRYGPRFDGYSTFVRLNQAFHEQIVAASGNPFLLEAFRGLAHDLLIARTLHDRGIPDLDEIAGEHDRIVRAFERRDPAAAEEAVSEHVGRGARRVLAAHREPDA
ncbi:MAG: GntR family transcriptional regulator [Thermoleophilia bacterium]|nr:GntR family transcriptional regulator [Thermoleophilia bacterium]